MSLWSWRRVVHRWDTAARYLPHDRDAIYRDCFRERVGSLGMKEVLRAPVRPGRTPTVKGWWAPSGENAWTTSWSGIRDLYDAFCEIILLTTSTRARTWRWPRMHQNRERWRNRSKAASYPLLKSAGCTIAIGDEPLRAKTGQNLSAVGVPLSLSSSASFSGRNKFTRLTRRGRHSLVQSRRASDSTQRKPRRN